MMRWIIWCIVSALLLSACVPIQPVEEAAGQEQVVAAPVQEDPDWAEFSAEGLNIWLPNTYVGGDLERDVPVIVEVLRAAGPDYAAFADTLEQNPSTYRFLAIDPDSVTSTFLTNVIIGREPVLSMITTELYLEALTNALPKDYEVLEQGQITHPIFEDAGRAIVTMTLPGSLPAKQVIYAIHDGGNAVWAVVYSTDESAFDELLPMFERSVASFSLTGE